MKKSVTPKALQTEMVVQELKKEVLIYNLKTNKASCLNESSAAIWRACDGTRNLAEIRRYVEIRLNHPITDEFILLGLESMRKAGLIAGEENFVSSANLNRRDIIRKAGLATMAALPVIASLTAPPAAHAASCSSVNNRNPGCPCTMSNQCLSGCCKASGTGANTCSATGTGSCLP